MEHVDGLGLPAAPVQRDHELLAEPFPAWIRGFDLARELPIRGYLFTTAPQEHVLLLVVHHIAADGWSAAPLARDLAAAYQSRLGGRPPELTPLPVQYADYASWQRELLGSEDDPGSRLSRQLGYWRTALANLPEELCLPADRPRPAVSTHRGGTISFDVPAKLHRDLSAIARQCDASLFMVVHAALAVLLTRLGAGTDIPVGTPVAGRTDDALADLVGFFVNTLVLRADTSGNPTFRELVRRVRQVDLAAYAHQDLPFERLVEDLNPARSLARQPLFQVMLVFQNTERFAIELPGLQVRPEETQTQTARFDLAVQLAERRDADGSPAGMDGEIEYSADLFEPGTAGQLANRFVALLRAITATPEVRLSALDALAPGERDWIRAHGHGRTLPLRASTLAGMFEANAAARPAQPAVTAAGTEVSFRQLNEQANRLARLLVDRGARPGTTVALFLSRSAAAAAATVAVLKCGAAFLPIDPAYPAERIAWMLADARPSVVITEAAQADPAPGGMATLVLDDPATVSALARYPDGDLTDAERHRPLFAQDAAYVVYTSGSTGTPKGVVVPHRAVVALITEQAARFAVGPDTRVLQFASVSFDAAVWELGMALFGGATAVLADDADRMAPGSLAGLIRGEGVNLAVLPPVVAGALGDDHHLPAGLTLIVAGEACPAEVAARWAGELTMINAYGPAEATVCVTMSDPLTGTGEPPIGRPLANTGLYVLDEHLDLVPAGVPGELYIAGAGLARGYLNQPGLTSQRLVPDPFGPPGTRMYRTGDVAHWRSDGSLHYAGRTDRQVKIRGHRIELGEVEAALTRHPSVWHAAVVTRADGPGAARLVGYAVTEASTEASTEDGPTGGALREHLARLLPGYMVRAAVVLVAALPLTANGKLDVAALPPPDYTGGTVSRPPRGRPEQVVADSFCAVLRLDRVGADDSFFDLGGDSIRAIQLVSRLGQAGLVVSAADVFVHQTVAALAAVADQRDPVGGEVPAADPFAPVLAIRPGPGIPLFCVHGGVGLSLPYLTLAQNLEADCPVYGLQARDGDAPPSITVMAAAYLERIIKIRPAGPYRLLGWSFGGLVAHEIAVQL